MATHRSVDLSLLSHFSPPGVFTLIQRDVWESLEPLPEVRERVDSIVSFCHLLRSDFHDKNDPSPDELVARRKYLRAALAEFSSMEDAALVDFPRVSRNTPPLMHSHSDPRIHIARLLRHANIHLSATSLSHAHRDAIWNGPDGPQNFTFLVILGEQIDASVLATRESKKYERAVLGEMLHWLDEEQREWGLGHVVLRTAELYGKYLAAAV